MRCENKFCVYCDKNKCSLEQVCINNLGLCSSCIPVDIDTMFLDKLKKEALEKSETAWLNLWK